EVQAPMDLFRKAVKVATNTSIEQTETSMAAFKLQCDGTATRRPSPYLMLT
ncbi:hypothetical protein AAVH_31269, partial [Aphelenchoides avenae]